MTIPEGQNWPRVKMTFAKSRGTPLIYRGRISIILNISRFNIIQYWTQHNSEYGKICSIKFLVDYELIKDVPYLALMGKLWSVFYEWFGDKILQDIVSALYLKINHMNLLIFTTHIIQMKHNTTKQSAHFMKCTLCFVVFCFDGLVQDCSNFIVLAMELLLQSCVKPSIWNCKMSTVPKVWCFCFSVAKYLFVTTYVRVNVSISVESNKVIITSTVK